MKIYNNIVAITFHKKGSEFEFLIFKKAGGEKYWSGWQFMQEAIDEGESEEDAVMREINEESGLKNIEIVKKLDIKTDYWYKEEGELVHKFLNFFLIQVDKGEKIKLSEEHSEYKWCSFEEAYSLLKYNKDLFKKAYEEMKKLEL